MSAFRPIEIPPALLDGGGNEILRVWVKGGALKVVMKLPPDPVMRCRLAALVLVDLAEMMATNGGAEDDPGGLRLQSVVRGFLEHLANPKSRPKVVLSN